MWCIVWFLLVGWNGCCVCVFESVRWIKVDCCLEVGEKEKKIR